jgi:hypothetical protein
MKLYRIQVPVDWPGCYYGTRDEAHHAIRDSERISNFMWTDCYIDLVEVGTTKEDIMTMLNKAWGIPGHDDTVLRSWRMTDRGGLKEVPVEKNEES